MLSNIAEGYGRRSLPEYLQFLYIAKGPLAEALTRGAGLWRVKLISDPDFEAFDKLHYEVENKLLRLIESLETKRRTNDWQDSLPIHQSINPSIRETATNSWRFGRCHSLTTNAPRERPN